MRGAEIGGDEIVDVREEEIGGVRVVVTIRDLDASIEGRIFFSFNITRSSSIGTIVFKSPFCFDIILSNSLSNFIKF